MKRCCCVAFWMLWGAPSQADTLVAARIIPANSIIQFEDVQIRVVENTYSNARIEDVVGMEARKALFAGRPILLSDVGIPAVVERNQVIELIFQSNGLRIKTEGRVLERAGPGDAIRVMNLASRSIVTALIDERGVGHVSH